MTTEEALDYLDKSKTDKEPSTPEAIKDESTVNAATEPLVQNDNADKGIDSGTAEDADTIESEDKADNNIGNETKTTKHPQQEKISYAFKRQKEKYRKQREAYESRIAELEKQLEDFRGLKLSDFNGNQDAYLRGLVQENASKQQLETMKAERDALIDEEINQKHMRRIQNCFPDPNEQEAYMDLLDRASGKLQQTLQEQDEDGAVYQFLSDSEVSPIITHLLITKPDIRERVLGKTSAMGKYAELQKIERIILSNQKKPERHQLGAKKMMPVLGSQVKNESAGDNGVRDLTYWTNYVMTHPK